MGSSSIYRNFSVIAVAVLSLSGLSMFGFSVVSGVQLSGELILVTVLIIVESSLAMIETRDNQRVKAASTVGDLKDVSGTPLPLGASQSIEIAPPEPEQE